MTGLAVLVGWMGVFAPLPGWKLVAVAPGGGSFFYPNIVGPDGSFVGRGPSPFSTLWYRATDQRLVVWDRGWNDNWQLDCGLGYVSFKVGDEYETYDLATGELILRVPGPAHRVGLSIVGDKTWDLQSGREVPAIPKTRLVWDTPRRRLGIQATERGHRVVEYEPGTTLEIRSARHRWGLVDHVWGDPDTGPFALQATASNGMPMTEIYTFDLQNVLTDEWRIESWGPLGVIQKELKDKTSLPDQRYRLVDPQKGEVLWERDDLNGRLIRWDGSLILLSAGFKESYLDARGVPVSPPPDRQRRVWEIGAGHAVNSRGGLVGVWRRAG